MTSLPSSPRSGLTTRPLLGWCWAVAALAAGLVAYQSVGAATSLTTARSVGRSSRPALEHHRLGLADGVVPDGTTVFARVPAVTRLNPQLSAALQRAASAAAGDGVTLYVNSGWRSRAYQQHLLDRAVATYGSRAEAARWVATPATSPHVRGEAVDIGGDGAAVWLSVHGAAYGLCQIYANEPWHFEVRPEAIAGGCPPAYADPTQDPRMRRR